MRPDPWVRTAGFVLFGVAVLNLVVILVYGLLPWWEEEPLLLVLVGCALVLGFLVRRKQQFAA